MKSQNILLPVTGPPQIFRKPPISPPTTSTTEPPGLSSKKPKHHTKPQRVEALESYPTESQYHSLHQKGQPDVRFDPWGSIDAAKKKVFLVFGEDWVILVFSSTSGSWGKVLGTKTTEIPNPFCCSLKLYNQFGPLANGQPSETGHNPAKRWHFHNLSAREVGHPTKQTITTRCFNEARNW